MLDDLIHFVVVSLTTFGFMGFAVYKIKKIFETVIDDTISELFRDYYFRRMEKVSFCQVLEIHNNVLKRKTHKI